MNFRELLTTTNWWGKAFGAFFGYLIAGSVGALFGLLIGNFFDRRLVHYLSNPHWTYHSEKRTALQKIFFETTFSIMGHIAKADGRVTEQEIQIAKVLMNEMRLNKLQKETAKKLYNQGKLPTFNLDAEIDQLKTACKDNRELLKLFVDIQYRAALVDGLSSKKIQTLDAILRGLNFAPLHQQYRFYEDFSYDPFQQQHQEQEQRQSGSYQSSSSQSSSSSSQRRYQAPKNNLDHAYALLEVDPSSNKQDVKRAYRRLMSRNHPDKLIAQGLPQEMIKMANDKTQRILKAYELVCASKGW